MEVKDKILEARRLKLEGMIPEQMITHFSKEKIYHKLVIVLINLVYKIPANQVGDIVYKNEYYKSFRNEHNPFTKDLFDELDNGSN